MLSMRGLHLDKGVLDVLTDLEHVNRALLGLVLFQFFLLAL
jgi:hypothetical protein